MTIKIDLLILKFIKYMIFTKLYRKNLNKEDRGIYDTFKKLRYGELIGVTLQNKNKTDYVSWKINHEVIDGIEIYRFYVFSIYNDKYYSYEFVPEYDNYESKLSNFDYMLIYVMNWYNNCIDEYLKVISRKKKLIEIKNKNIVKSLNCY